MLEDNGGHLKALHRRGQAHDQLLAVLGEGVDVDAALDPQSGVILEFSILYSNPDHVASLVASRWMSTAGVAGLIASWQQNTTQRLLWSELRLGIYFGDLGNRNS